MRHVNFSPHPPSAAVSNTSSPVTEIVTCYFEAYDEGYADKIDRLFQAFEKAPGFKTAASGWVIEDIEHEKIGSGKKGKAFVGALGCTYLSWSLLPCRSAVAEDGPFSEILQICPIASRHPRRLILTLSSA